MNQSSSIHILLVHQERPPLQVDMIRQYFERRHAYFRRAARLLGMRVSVVSVTEVIERAKHLEAKHRPLVWFDMPPLPPADHERLCEDLWGQGISALEPPQTYLNSWDISRWYPKLQGAFVRQPPTAIIPTTPGTDFSDPSTVAVLERTLRAVEPLGGVKKGAGAREILRPFFGWSPLYELDGMAPWEGLAAANLRRLGPFLVQQQELWDLPVGGIALQYLPPHVPDIPVLRIYAIGGAPIWWTARSMQFRGDRMASFRLWGESDDRQIVSALAELTTTIANALGVGEFVFETASVPHTNVFDVRPIAAVFEPCHGAHFATVICLAAFLKGLALGHSPDKALHEIPKYSQIVAALQAVAHSPIGHGPFNLGPAAELLAAPLDAVRGAGPGN